MRNVVVINGPNLNLLGTREPEVYGYGTLADLDTTVIGWGTELGLSVEAFQSNHEGEVIERLHQAGGYADGVVLNAGALTHYSYALHDAISAIALPTVEVHISNIRAREMWRAHSVIAPACVYSIYGRGKSGYRDALRHLIWRSASPPMTVSYGPAEDQVGDLRVPAGDGPHPVVVVIHGGFWADVWTRDLMDGIATDLSQRGWATWNIEYRRAGSGGGWPGTFIDVASAIDALGDLATEHSLNLGNVVTLGHSAGGHLALWAAARPRLPGNMPGAGPRVIVSAAAGISPVADLAEAHRRDLGGGAVAGFLGADPDAEADRYDVASPAAMLPIGIKQVVVHGDQDVEVPVAMSEAYAGAAADAGDPVVYHELAGVGHYEILDPGGEPWQVVAAEIEELRTAE